MNARTKANLQKAMQSEALGFAQNSRFAACARMNGNGHLARLFQLAADEDRCEHFARESRMAGAIATDEENLRSAISLARQQVEMYSEFVEEAIADHDLGAAALFSKIRDDEASQMQHFHEELEKLQGQKSNSGFEAEDTLQALGV